MNVYTNASDFPYSKPTISEQISHLIAAIWEHRTENNIILL